MIDLNKNHSAETRSKSNCMTFTDALTAGFLALLSGPALAQATASSPFPSRQLHFIVPFPAGGTLDVLARAVGNELGPHLARRSWSRTVPAPPACSGRSSSLARRPMGTHW